MKNLKCLEIIEIICVIVAWVMLNVIGFFSFGGIEYFTQKDIKSDAVEEVIENNSEDIILFLIDEKKNNFTIYYDEVIVEKISNKEVKASGYGYTINYILDDNKLQIQNINRDYIYQSPIMFITFSIGITLLSMLVLVVRCDDRKTNVL